MQPAMQSAPRRFTILVVEDDANFAASVAEILRLEGNDVAIAATATDAIRMARALAPDAVLLDLALPDGNGYDVARVLRRDHVGRDAAIVALTGTSVEVLEPADSAGIDLVLNKPVNCDLLGGLLVFVRSKRGR